MTYAINVAVTAHILNCNIIPVLIKEQLEAFYFSTVIYLFCYGNKQRDVVVTLTVAITLMTLTKDKVH